MSADIKWNVDYCVHKNNIVYGHGWYLNKGSSVVSARVFIKGTENYIPVVVNIDRADVAKANPDTSSASNSGFLFYGSFLEDVEAKILKIEFRLADGNVNSIEVEAHDTNLIKAHDSKVNINVVLSLINKRFFRVFFSQGIKKTLCLARKILSFFLLKRLNFDRFFRLIECNYLHREIVVILDHGLGGGANHYTKTFINQIKKKSFIVLVSFNISTLNYRVELISGNRSELFLLDELGFLLDKLPSIKINKLIINNIVSYPEPIKLIHRLIKLKNQTGVDMLTLVHDFYPLCPSHFLVDYSGKYCGIPELSYCNTCLKNNTYGFNTLIGDVSIDVYRTAWTKLLRVSDEVRFFSKSTLEIFSKVIDTKLPKFTIIPHTMEYMPTGKVKIKNQTQLHIGIIGSIAHHKGSQVIEELVQQISKRNLEVKVTVIGTIDKTIHHRNFDSTGPYKQKDLKSLIEKKGVNLVFFSSIWPETFSYVVGEVMAMDLPIVAFNIGAPAERLLNYEKSMLINLVEPDEILNNLINFFNKIYIS